MGDEKALLEAEREVRFLSEQVRRLKADLWDSFAAAALQGLLGYYGDVSHIVTKDSRTSLAFAAADHADALLAERAKRFGAPLDRCPPCSGDCDQGRRCPARGAV